MRSASSDRLFILVFGTLTLLAVAPFWRTHLLPMQDYPQLLALARAYGDCRDPASPFFGTYTTGFPLSPLLLPILLVRGIGAIVGLETAGRILWTLYAAGLPAASLYLLRVLGRDRWAVLLMFPLVISYWVIGGFFAFATAAPLLILGLAVGVRWLEAPSWRRGLALAATACALHLWHALAFAQLVFDFGVLWVLVRQGNLGTRARALVPMVPALMLFGSWMLVNERSRPPGSRPAWWAPLVDNASQFFAFIGPIVPGAGIALALLAIVVLGFAIAGIRARAGRASGSPAPFRVANPFAWLALLAALSSLAFPMVWLGVEGIANRQPWIAALLFVFSWSLPTRPAARAALLGLVGVAGGAALVHLGGRFAAFDRESAGASRLIDRLGPGDTLLAPVGVGSTTSFPGKPLIGVELYATVRHGGLPNSSFAGYDINLVRYVNNHNPMPGIRSRGWLDHAELARFDYVLLRDPVGEASARPRTVRLLAQDDGWDLYAVCGGRARPECP